MFGFLRRGRLNGAGRETRNPIDPYGIQKSSQNFATSWGAEGKGSNHPTAIDGMPVLKRPRPKPRRL